METGKALSRHSSRASLMGPLRNRNFFIVDSTTIESDEQEKKEIREKGYIETVFRNFPTAMPANGG